MFICANMNMTRYIKWTNRHSGETGYVKMIRTSNNHFINTYDKGDARKYRSEAEANKAICVLQQIGEGQNNDFVVVS